MDERRAVGYARVSTEEQAREGISLDVQESRIRSWCQGRGFSMIGFHVDAGLSGTRADNREGLQAALRDARRDRAALVVTKLDRLSRSTKDSLAIAEDLDRAGVSLISLSEGDRIDTTTAGGRLTFTVRVAVNQHGRDVIAEKTAAALAYKRERGEHTGGDAPFGYDLDADGIHLVPNPQEQRAIRLVKRLRREGLSLREIAAELDRRGIATKRGGTWSAVQVSRVLKSKRAA